MSGMSVEADYVYRAELEWVVDGDTVDMRVDCGFSIYTGQRSRLYGINTPKVGGVERPEGLAAKEYVIKICKGGRCGDSHYTG